MKRYLKTLPSLVELERISKTSKASYQSERETTKP